MQKIQLSLTLVVFLTLIGCDRSGRLEGLVPASGTLLFNGTPVEGATIIFAPDSDGSNVRSASATTDAKGKFTLATLQHADGAYPNRYQVTVTKTLTTGDLVWEESANDPGRGRLIDTQMVADMLPAKYGDKDTSDLTVEIPSKGNKNIVLELSGEVDSTPRKLDTRAGR